MELNVIVMIGTALVLAVMCVRCVIWARKPAESFCEKD
jgi:hypothetical protein